MYVKVQQKKKLNRVLVKQNAKTTNSSRSPLSKDFL
jgi:hypothetical protein